MTTSSSKSNPAAAKDALAAHERISAYKDQLQHRPKERITLVDLHWLWHNASNEDLKELAAIVRARFHEPNTAIYQIMRIINYTNICVAKCDYCAFYRLPGSPEGYLRSKDYIFNKIDELKAIGGDLFGFNGGFNPELKIDYYIDLFSSIRARYGDGIEMYSLTVVELIYIARISKLTVAAAVEKLKAAGVRWIPGGGAEILADTFRKRHSPTKYTVEEFFAAQRDILNAGLNTTSTMVIGFDESLEERFEHLESVRNFQDSVNGGLYSFLCWNYKPYNNELGGVEIGSEEYLRHIALCRIYLDNFVHIKPSTLTMNEAAIEGLHYGGNYFDIPWEDEVTQSAGATVEQDVEKALAYAHKAGFKTSMRRITQSAPTKAPAV